MRAPQMPDQREAADRLLVFSADGHAGGRLQDYRPYLEQKHHGDLDDLAAENETYVRMNSALTAYTPESLAVVDGAGRIAGGGIVGAWEAERRLAERDAEGIVGEVILGVTRPRPCRSALRHEHQRAAPERLRPGPGKPAHTCGGGRLVAGRGRP